MTALPIELLMAEDSPEAARLAREALRDARLDNQLTVVPDGVEALAYLRRESPYTRAPRPDLLLLDWELPRKSGREVLAELKADPALRHTPVVVLTSSAADADLARAYGLDPARILAKPIALAPFLAAVQSFPAFRIAIVRSPDEA